MVQGRFGVEFAAFGGLGVWRLAGTRIGAGGLARALNARAGDHREAVAEVVSISRLGCGFESAPDDPAVVRLIGHATLLAVRIENGSLIGHMSDEFGAQGWWDYKLKKARDGRTYIERMTRKIGKRKQAMKFTFTTKKGAVVYKSFERVVKANPYGRGDDDQVGVLKFKLTKLLVDVKE